MGLHTDTVNGNALLLQRLYEVKHAIGLGTATFDVEVIDLVVFQRSIYELSFGTQGSTYVEFGFGIGLVGGLQSCRNVIDTSSGEEDRFTEGTVFIEGLCNTKLESIYRRGKSRYEPLMTSQLSIETFSTQSLE